MALKIDISKLKEAYGVDQKAEVEGKWFNLGLIDGVRVKVARTSNPSYQKALEREYKPYQKQLRKGGSLAPTIHERISVTLVAEELLKDWKGMPGQDGKDVPFSVKLAKELLSDPELKEMKNEISDFADEFDAYRVQQDKVLEKN